MIKIFIILILSAHLQAAVIGPDDRTDIHELNQDEITELSSRVVSIVRRKNLIKNQSNFKMQAKSLQAQIGFCEDAVFSEEPLFANCSGALIDKDLILTAAHCIDKENKDEFYVVFDYVKSKQGKIPTTYKKEQVFEIKEFLYHEFTMKNDLAVLRIDREINRTPLTMDLNYKYLSGSDIFMLGHPLGVSQKYTGTNPILAVHEDLKSFRTELDAFSVNSGSPIFDERTHKIIGVLVRGTGVNYQKLGRDCYDWGVGREDYDFSDGNTLTPLKEEGRF